MRLTDQWGIYIVFLGCFDLKNLDKKRKRSPEETADLQKKVKNLQSIQNQQKALIKKLEANERKYSSLFHYSNDAIILIDLKGNILDVNPKGLNLFGFNRDEILSKKITHLLDGATLEKAEETFKVLNKLGFIQFDIDFKRKKGAIFPSEVSASIFESNGRKLGLCIVRDITERKKAEEILRRSEERFRSVVDNSNNAILIIDERFCVSYVNEEISRILGYSRQEVLGHDFRTLLDKHAGKDLEERFIKRQKGAPVPPRYEICVEKKDGEKCFLEISSNVIISSSGKKETVAQLTDLTERKKAAEKENNYIRDLKFLSKTAMSFVTLQTEDEILVLIAEHLKRMVKDSIVAVLTHDNKMNRFFVNKLLGIEGKIKSLEKMLKKSSDMFNFKVSPEIWEALLSGKLTNFSWDLHKMTSGEFSREINRELKMLLGVNRIHTIGLTYKGELYGAGVILTKEKNALKNKNIIEAFIHQASIVLQRLRTENELRRSFIKIRKTLEETVETLASAVEIKDPYTAGHQKRVSRLATAIAEEMQLPEDKIRGLHLAAAIHDIGKIYIPAEILTKPGSLTSIEFDLIKTHPQVGSDILKSIDFPWPIAKIILQHHEKIDGSGYPHGLTDKDILLEAKILVVADVVEAISSHRPYRPALGPKRALEEISIYKNTLFSPEVVDACYRIFEQGKFHF